MNDDGEQEVNPHANIFTIDVVQRELQEQMSQLSPRRTASSAQDSSERHATTTLPFYNDISPSEALKNLFDWFSSDAPVAAPQESQDAGDAATATAEPKVTLEGFNKLRKCLGKPVVTEREWERGLETLGEAVVAEKRVPRQHFKALFGPPPFFGNANVERIVRDVMDAEERIHFAKILVSRFGAERAQLSSLASRSLTDSDKVLGLEHVQELQRAACTDAVFDRDDWSELCRLLQLGDPASAYLTWMEFAAAFHVSVRSKKMCAPHADPAATVYAVLANEHVLDTIKDPGDDQVSQKAFTNLLRVKKEKVDDEVWLDLLRNMQTTYSYRDTKRMGRKNSFADTDARDDDARNGHGHDQPLFIVRNTRNQVLSYEIVFDEHGDIGLDLQSDFLGQCVTVARKSGQAERHSIIQTHDIVAEVNGTRLIKDSTVATREEELARVADAKRLLNANTVRKVTFYRQESYYQYSVEDKALFLYLKTFEIVPPDGRFYIQVPPNASWKPESFSTDDGSSSLVVTFESPKHEDFEHAIVTWNDATQTIEIVLDGDIAIAEQSTVEIKVTGIDCGNSVVLGPCELASETIQVAPDESAPACLVSMFLNWNNRESTLEHLVVRRASDGYVDTSLKPKRKSFPPGPSGLSVQSDFFGQCVVVTEAQFEAEKQGVLPHDILSSITSFTSDGKTANQLYCIKPFAQSKENAEAHISRVQDELEKCRSSRRPYDLEFLRLNSYFFHDAGRTIFTFHALTTLRDGSSLAIKMPSARWRLNGLLTARVLDPSGVKVSEVLWDSQNHSVHLTLESCSIPETDAIVVEILGVSPPPKAKSLKSKLLKSDETRCAGPSEVVGFFAGDASNAPQLEFVLHEHWHSFIVGHQGIEASKVNETLKTKFKTSPAMLWEVLEYTSRLFEKCKARDAETLLFADMNKLINVVCGEKKVMDQAKWNALCRTLGAKPLVGLSRRQFACCWSEVTGLSSHSAKEVYVRIHTAERLFREVIHTFQHDDVVDDIITLETIKKLAGVGGFDAKKATKILTDEDRKGWDCDLFCQIVCGGNRSFKFEDNASSLWIKIFYAKKLFKDFSDYEKLRKKRGASDDDDALLAAARMYKADFADLLAALKVTKPKLSEKTWTTICDSVELDETSGFSFGHFLEVYSRKPLGPRHPLADYYRIETFKMLPELSTAPSDVSKEAVLSVAPERVDVLDVALKALDETASADEVFQELLSEKLEFSKLEKIEVREDKEFVFTAALAAKHRSRVKGFLHLQVMSISELVDKAIDTSREFNRDDKPEELYAMFEITDAAGVKARMPVKKKHHGLRKARTVLFGGKAIGNKYDVKPDELWDNGVTQRRMRKMHDVEKQLAALEASGAAFGLAYDETYAKMAKLMKRLTPSPDASAGPDAFSGRVFSSVLLRDPSPDAIVRFPDDQFRVYVDTSAGTSRKLLVCKLFKRIGSEKSRLELELGYATEAHAKADATFTILKDLVEQQEHHLRHLVAYRLKKDKDAVDENAVWADLSKLRQKRQELVEFEAEVTKRKALRDDLQIKLDAVLAKEEQQVVEASVADAGADTDAPSTTAAASPTTQPLAKKSDGEIAQVQLIGLAMFDLEELLDVLHGDKETTDDVRLFRTESDKDVGRLRLKFEYKCALLQHESPCAPLPVIDIAMSGNDDTSAVELIQAERAREYPSHSHLEIEWTVSDLMEKDRLVLVREGDKHKLSIVYFIMIWRNPNKLGDGECDWWVPLSYRTQYSIPGEKHVVTDDSRRHGVVQFPSSIGLSLPPGTYKVYLIRNESVDDGTGKLTNYRTVLGRTESLAVLPGHNSVHTSFGTTPLIDVTPLYASLQVYTEKDRAMVEGAIANKDGYFDQTYRDRIENEQEIEVTKRDLKECAAQYAKLQSKKEGAVVKERLARLEDVLAALEAQKAHIVAASAPAQQAEQARLTKLQAKPVFACNDELVLSYRFFGGKPLLQDRILILPADVVRVSDNLRSTILGKLQGNNAMQVEAIRKSLEFQLAEVGQLITRKFTFWGLVRILRRLVCAWCRKSKDDDSDENKTFVWDECLLAFKAAPPIARKNFGFILRDLLEEIDARKAQLGLEVDPDAPSFKQVPKLHAVLKTGIDVPVLPLARYREQQRRPLARLFGVSPLTPQELQPPEDNAVGECKVRLANRFRTGGHFVAKYVRRAGASEQDNAEGANISECVGEICRFGPFYVEPAWLSWSPVQWYFMVKKLLSAALKSDLCKLWLKVFGHVLVSFLKYFLGVVSLSFNISVLAGNFRIDTTKLEAILAAFQARLSYYYGPIEWLLKVIYTFFNDFIQPLLDKLKFPDMVDECVAGFYLFPVLALLFAATFVVYVVVQEDLLLKVQKIHSYLPINPGKKWLGILEQVGALLVIPLYLTIKSCVLFISGQWSYFYDQLNHPAGLAVFKLVKSPHGACTDEHLVTLNYRLGILALVLIVAFLFICLPLLLLDLYSWVPLSELEKPEQLKKLAHSFGRADIKAAVHSNASLVECRYSCRCKGECVGHPVWWHKLRAWCRARACCRMLQRCKLPTCCRFSTCCRLPSCCNGRFGNGLRWIGATIVRVCRFLRRCVTFKGFRVYYSDYTTMSFRLLIKKYGVLGLLSMFTYVYMGLMLQSMARSLGVLVGWRGRASHMYKNPAAMPVSTYKFYDRFCLRFNFAWKVQYIKDKMVMPFVNVVLVTLGLWGEHQWKEFNVEERANNCYVMEPSSEIKQLQMMSLHGKIVSLFWLCIPKTMVLAYLAEVLNRGPVFGYFLNKKFLQADIPESERERDPVWRFVDWCKFPGEEDVVYLTDTRFYSTVLKWGSSVVEIVTLLMVYPAAEHLRGRLFGCALLSAAVSPLLEFNQQAIKAYVDYKEAIENFGSSNDLFAKLSKAKETADDANKTCSKCPRLTLNLRSSHRAADTAPAASSAPDAPAASALPETAEGAPAGAPVSNDAAEVEIVIDPGDAPTKQLSDDSAKATAVRAPAPTAPSPPSPPPLSLGTKAATAVAAAVPATVHIGGGDDDGEDEVEEDAGALVDNLLEETDDVGDEIKNALGDDGTAALLAAAEVIKPKKELILLNALPEVSYVVLTNALDKGEGEITVNWQVNAKQRFHALDAIGMFPAREPGDTRLQAMEDCICYRLLKDRDAEEFGWKPDSRSKDDFEREVLSRRAKSLRDLAESDIKALVTSSVQTTEDGGMRESHDDKIEAAKRDMAEMLKSPKLKPYTKKMSAMLEEEVLEKRIDIKVHDSHVLLLGT